eukprot:1161126-Pelagomonas_calceolata.AAC.8
MAGGAPQWLAHVWRGDAALQAQDICQVGAICKVAMQAQYIWKVGASNLMTATARNTRVSEFYASQRPRVLRKGSLTSKLARVLPNVVVYGYPHLPHATDPSLHLKTTSCLSAASVSTWAASCWSTVPTSPHWYSAGERAACHRLALRHEKRSGLT